MQERVGAVKPGMLVRLRRRLWRVEAFDGKVLTATPVDDFGASPQDFILSLETVKPGTLPDPTLNELGRIPLQRLFLQAARLDALHGTAPFLAIQRTAVIPVEYQLVPLVMAMQQDPVRLLIADILPECPGLLIAKNHYLQTSLAINVHDGIDSF